MNPIKSEPGNWFMHDLAHGKFRGKLARSHVIPGRFKRQTILVRATGYLSSKACEICYCLKRFMGMSSIFISSDRRRRSFNKIRDGGSCSARSNFIDKVIRSKAPSQISKSRSQSPL